MFNTNKFNMDTLWWIFVSVSLLSIKNFVHSFNATILYLHGDWDGQMTSALQLAITDLSSHHGVQVSMEDVINIQVKGRGPKDILDPVCAALDESLSKGKVPLVLDVTESGVASETIKSFVAAMHLPTVATSYGQDGDIKAWSILGAEEHRYLIQIQPPVDIVTEVMRSFASSQNMTNLAVIYDDFFILTPKVTSFLQSLGVRNVQKPIASDIRHQIKEISSADFKNFFIVARKWTAENAITKAHELNVIKKYNWYVITLEKERIVCDCDGSVLTLMPTPEEDSRARLENIILPTLGDMNLEINVAFYFDVFARAIYATQVLINEGNWPPAAFLTSCYDFEEGKIKPYTNLDLRRAMKEATIIPWMYAPLQVDSNGRSFMKFEMVVEEVTFTNKGQEDQIQKIAKWRAGFDNPLVLTEGSSLKDLTSRPKYVIVTNEQPPFVMKTTNTRGIHYFGICFDLLHEIQKYMDFDYEIYEVPDGKMGYLSDDGDWSGVVGELVEKRADIGLTAISVMAERQRVIDFTIPYYDEVGISILMKKSQTPTSLFKFLTVLETDVWLCILAAYFLTSLLMWIFDRWSPYSYQNNIEKYKDDDEKRIFNFRECLWFCMTSLTPQGGGEAPKNLSGRLVAATWWLFGFIIMASYTANLAAFLTVSRLDVQIESLDDLTKQYKIQYAPINGSLEMRYFERMAAIETRFYEMWKDMSLNDSLTPLERSKLAVWDYPISDKFTKMWQSMLQIQFPNSIDDAVDRIRESKSSSDGFALLGDATDNIYQSLTNCDLQIIGNEFSRKPYAIALQKGSHLQKQFNDILQELYNQGRIHDMKKYWWDNITTTKSCENLNEETDGISIKNIGGVFMVILVGVLFALITLCLEYFLYRCQRSIAIRNTIVHIEGWAEAEYPGSQKIQKTEATGNKYLDPLTLYGDHFTRRNIQQRSDKKKPW